ncbi:MAG: dimethylsulfonioproprionate lyase family protein [Hyphomicrobiales bacterium]
MRTLFDAALSSVEAFYKASPELMDFVPFPDSCDLSFEPKTPRLMPAVKHFNSDESLHAGPFDNARRALLDLKDEAFWREPYKGTDLAQTFMDRFCVYELFGLEGHFKCQTTRGFIVYSTGNLYYPWHHHPAEELYFIIAGEAAFATEGNAPKLLKAGDTAFHAANQPHNMQTHDKGVLAWVQWRGDLETPPEFTDRLNE